MMMDCPRCGFSQPKDRYCANCGLDVDHFKPVPESKAKKLVQSAAFQVTAVVIIVVALASGIYTAQKKEIAEQLDAAQQNMMAPETNPPAADQSTSGSGSPGLMASRSAEANATAAAATSEAEPPADSIVATGESQMVESSGTQQVVTESTANGEQAAALATTRIKSLNIQFVEIPRIMAEQLAAENQILDRSGNTYSFVILSQPSPSSLGAGVRPLPGSTTRPASTTQKIELSFQPQLIVDFNTLNIGEQDIEFEVMSQIALWDASSGKVSNIAFNGKYTIPKGSTLVIVGMLPHQQIRQEDLQVFAGTPLSIMASAAFKNSSSEFAIFIQPK
jgi:hypothetical protein